MRLLSFFTTTRWVFFLLCLWLAGCDQIGVSSKQGNALGNRPDLDCIIANDFYAVHFSAYIQPTKGEPLADPKAAFVPYCQKIPRPGKMFFTADLIDRDIRSTPIAIRVVEVEKTGQAAPNDVRELRTVAEIPVKLYPRGAVEAQADIDKNGDYLVYFLIGDALEEDDKFRVALEVGVDPNAIPPKTLAIMIGGGVLLLSLLGWLVITLKARFQRKRSAD
jgi:hypothetical protein